MKKFLSTMLFVITASYAAGPLVPTVGHLQNAYYPCLTDHGKSISFLNGNKFAPTVNIVDAKEWDYLAKYAPHLNYGEELQCGRKSIIIQGNQFIRQLSTKDAHQIDVKGISYKNKLRSKRIVVGNTLFESGDTIVRVRSLDNFQRSHDIKWPSDGGHSLREYSESTLYMRQVKVKDDIYYLIDVKSGEIRDISPQLKGCTYAKLTSNGVYLQAACSGEESRVFNTKTLKRVPALERYLSSINKNKYQALSVKFFDQYQQLLLIAAQEKFIAWDIKNDQPKYVNEIPYSYPNYNHQDGTVLISGGPDKPYTLLDVKNGQMRYQPFAYNKPFALFIQNRIPKAVLETGPMSIGIWNLLEHKWEQRFNSDPFFKENQFSSDSIKPLISGDNMFFPRGYWKGNDPIHQYSLKSGKLLFTYRADSFGNIPNSMEADAVHNRLIVHYQNIPKCDGFKIYDTKNGTLLYDLKAPQRHLMVTSMQLSDDGKKLIVRTQESKGSVNMEEEGYYNYDNKPSIITWDLSTQKVTIEPCKNLCKSLPRLQKLGAKANGFNVFWDKKHRAVAITKEDNPYRQIYMYMPYDTSEWIDIDNFGYFDTSKNGDVYVYMCNDDKCRHLDDTGRHHFKRPGMLERFLQKK